MGVPRLAEPSSGVVVAYGMATGLFCAMVAFSSFAYLTQSTRAKGFTLLGVPPPSG